MSGRSVADEHEQGWQAEDATEEHMGLSPAAGQLFALYDARAALSDRSEG